MAHADQALDTDPTLEPEILAVARMHRTNGDSAEPHNHPERSAYRAKIKYGRTERVIFMDEEQAGFLLEGVGGRDMNGNLTPVTFAGFKDRALTMPAYVALAPGEFVSVVAERL